METEVELEKDFSKMDDDTKRLLISAIVNEEKWTFTGQIFLDDAEISEYVIDSYEPQDLYGPTCR